MHYGSIHVSVFVTVTLIFLQCSNSCWNDANNARYLASDNISELHGESCSYEILSDKIGQAIVTEVCCGWLRSIDNECQCVSANTMS